MTDDGPTLGLVDVDGTIRIATPRKVAAACVGGGHRFLLDVPERTIRCSRCEQVFDPFDAILDIATVRERYSADAAHLTQQRASLLKEVQQLKAARDAARSALSATNRRLKQRRAVDDYETTGSGESRALSSPASAPAP